MYQESAVHDKWIKRWFVVRRPYIYIYSNHSETDEQGVINVSSVRIDYNRALEQMIEVFTKMKMVDAETDLGDSFFLAAQRICPLYQQQCIHPAG